MATLIAPLSLVQLSVYANNPWSVTEPDAVGVPGCLHELSCTGTATVAKVRGNIRTMHAHHNSSLLPWHHYSN